MSSNIFYQAFHFFFSLMLFFVQINGFAISNDSIFKTILEQNRCAIPIVEEEWPDEDLRLYFMRCMKYQSELNEQKKRSAVFKILDNSSFKKECIDHGICNDQTTWQDLNLFCGQKDPAKNLAAILDQGIYTAFGHGVLYAMLVTPTVAIENLRKKQEIIRYLVENPAVLECIENALAIIAESENMVLSFWCDDPIRQEIKKEHYLEWPIKSLRDAVNKSQTGLALLNSWTHIERFIFLRDYILGALFVTVHHGLCLAGAQSPEPVQDMASWLQHERGITPGPILSDLSSYIESNTGKNMLGLLAGLYALMNVNDWACWVRDQLYLDNCLHMKMMYVAQYVDGISSLHNLLKNNNRLRHAFSLTPALDSLFNANAPISSDMRQLLELLTHPCLKEKPSFFTHKGRALLGFKLFNENKEHFEDALTAIGQIDAYVALAKLYKEHQNKAVHYCFVDYIQADKPMLEIRDFWNPFIDGDKAVLNSLKLGFDNSPGNVIITGPNAGGKSTLLKSIAINVLMAQSFGIAPCSAMAFTPFNKITSYMNITDDIGAGNSLFKAQVLRAQELLEYVQKLESKKFCFVIIDEMFNGTSPLEAEAAAYSVAKNLGSHAHAMNLIATHYPLLTTLEKDTNNFSNYSVQVEVAADGTITYPFKLIPGVVNQHIAIDILKSQGFNGSIIEDAQAIIKNRG